MNPPLPHYQLYCQAGCQGDDRRWRFVVRNDDGSPLLEAADAEPDVAGDRLELLTVVRGLEALDEPARVTLSSTPYVRQGIQYGMAEWRDNGWRWEWFGQMVPVKNADLWQRLDHILQFHHVSCQQRRFDTAHDLPAPQASEPRELKAETAARPAPRRVGRAARAGRGCFAALFARVRRWFTIEGPDGYCESVQCRAVWG